MTKSLSKLCLPALTAALLPAFSLAEAQKTPADYQAQLDCASPRNQALLNAAMHPDPRANVWVLEVLNSMGLNRHCPELREDLIANYLERQAANDIVQEAIGQPATMRDAPRLAMLAGIALTWLMSFGQRARMARIASVLAIAIVALFISAVGLFMLNGQSLGMGAAALSLFAGRAALGAIVGVLAMRMWAARAKPD